jgi:hypothetical protein
MNIIRLYNKVASMDTEKVAIVSVEESKGPLVDKNRERMLDGIRSDGSEMPIYSYISQTVYGYPNERIKLRDTGAFQNSIFVIVSGLRILTDSRDQKSPVLQQRYGPRIFGTGGQYKIEFIRESLRPAFKANITLATGLKFK